MTELPEKNVPFVNPRAAHDFRGRTCSIVSVGSYVPERRLSNAELEKLVDTSDEWITTRTGIKERRLAADDQFTSDLAVEAAKKALEKADIDPEAIDLIIVATITPDMPFPSTACLVQSALGARQAACFDMEAACSGFLYSVETARNFIRHRRTPRLIYMLADQSPGARERVYVTHFLNRQTAFFSGAATLAKATGFPVAYARCRRLRRGYFDIELIEICRNPDELGEDGILQRYAELTEASIRECPDDWLWSNRRWKHQVPTAADNEGAGSSASESQSKPDS